jgi:hypothetical protein
MQRQGPTLEGSGQRFGEGAGHRGVVPEPSGGRSTEGPRLVAKLFGIKIVLFMTEYALYLDDGGHPDNQPFLVVAGYMATTPQWTAFESAWKATLSRFKLEPTFHMTDFMHTSHKYTTLRLDQILGALAATTKKFTLRPFICAVDMAAYKRVNAEFAFEECHGAPYAITARSLATELNLWKSQTLGPGDNLLTFVEEGTKHYGDMEQVFKRDKLPIPTRVLKSVTQVQPADILAWEQFNYLKNGSPERPGKNLDRLTRYIRKKQTFGGILYDADLRRICADTDVYLRSTLKPGDTIAFSSEKKRKRKRTIK